MSWMNDTSNDLEEAVERKPDGCLTMKVGVGATKDGGIDFKDVAKKN